MEIGLFQLENLFQNPNRFVFLDLRVERKLAGPALDKMLNQAIAVTGAAVLERLTFDNVPKEYPIVLLCEDGKTSARVARDLEAAGYSQLYKVAGGVEGLLSEV
jgi:rhodanese-related sulfurtransferase